MNKIVKLLTTVIAVAALGSCKKTFDNPPGPADPNIVANKTIKDLKALHTTNGAYDVITSDIIISGIVVADDKSGNFYKQLYIQDSTGGLQILLDANSLYGTYPVGRRIFIRCNGLCISDYNRTMELGVKALVAGSPSLEGIPANLVNKYVVGGTIGNPVVPIQVTAAQLTTGLQDKYIGSLIQLDDYEFIPSNLNRTYADTSVYKSTTNDTIKTCAPNSNLIVRTSAYADFASQQVAQGHGSIIAIYTVFGNTKQLIIRDTSDVKFYAPLGCPLPPGTLLSQDFESITTPNATLALPGWKNIGEVGGVAYQNAIFGPVKCAKISAFSTGVATVSSWLITPSINLTGATAPKLTFTSAAGYAVGATGFKVLISSNYAGSNTPSTSTWTQLPATIAAAPASGYSSFISSGTINLSAYIGQTVYIAFQYDGGDPTKTTTFEIDDVKVTAL
ncbi:MAG: DUF5689 domain-containing protein [Ferruginibacter sp.]